MTDFKTTFTKVIAEVSPNTFEVGSPGYIIRGGYGKPFRKGKYADTPLIHVCTDEEFPDDKVFENQLRQVVAGLEARLGKGTVTLGALTDALENNPHYQVVQRQQDEYERAVKASRVIEDSIYERSPRIWEHLFRIYRDGVRKEQR